MIDFHFLDVGAGDSIFLTWDDGEQKKCLVLDCKKQAGTNPVLDAVKNLELTEIEYVILSHPHYDHFSGMLELLQYCQTSSISISYFLHTSKVKKEFITSLDSTLSKQEYVKLFKKVKELAASGMKTAAISQDSPSPYLPIKDGFSCTILAPFETQTNEFMLRSHDDKKPNENILSTVLCIEASGNFVLLTADAEVKVLMKLQKNLKMKEKKYLKKFLKD